MAKKTRDEIKNIIAQEIDNATGRYGDQISQDREDAIKRYYGDEYGDERPGRSKVITSECRDTVGWLLPGLIDVFMSTDHVAEFQPERPEDKRLSEQVTDYVNYVFFDDNQGYSILRTWFSDALISKNGFVKWYWDTSDYSKKENFTGLDNIALNELLSQDGVELLEQEFREEIVIDPESGIQIPLQVNDVVIQKSGKRNRVKIENIAPENILIDRQATSINDARFVCHIVRKTRSDLVKQGFDKKIIETLPEYNYDEFNGERLQRYYSNDLDQYYDQTSPDKSTQYVAVYECYVKIDTNNDGKDELRKITCAGQGVYEILDDEEVDVIPIATITPYHQPHVFYGRSVVDETKDLQRINTSLMRGVLDYMYLTVNPRYRISDNDKTAVQDFLLGTPGGAIRARESTRVEPLVHPPLPNFYFDLFEKLENMRESRTGVSRLNQGLDPDTINKTATGMTKIMQAGKQREKLIAREFAETGVRALFTGIYTLTVKHQDIPRTVRLRNEWVQVDPTQWPESMDLNVTVGLGTGDMDKKLAELSQILDYQKEALQVGLAGPQNIYNTLSKMLATIGYKDVGEFFVDPETIPPQEDTGPTPEQQMAQQQLEMQQQGMAMQAQNAQVRNELDKYKADLKAEMDKYKADLDAALKRGDQNISVQETKARISADLVDQDIQERTLNGAQINAMANVVAQVSKGEIPRETAHSILQVGFGLSPQDADVLLSSAGSEMNPDQLSMDIVNMEGRGITNAVETSTKKITPEDIE